MGSASCGSKWSPVDRLSAGVEGNGSSAFAVGTSKTCGGGCYLCLEWAPVAVKRKF